MTSHNSEYTQSALESAIYGAESNENVTTILLHFHLRGNSRIIIYETIFNIEIFLTESIRY